MLGAKHTVCAWERDGTQPWERKKLTKINALSTQHSTAHLALSGNTTPLQFPVFLLISSSGHHAGHATGGCHLKHTETHTASYATAKNSHWGQTQSCFPVGFAVLLAAHTLSQKDNNYHWGGEDGTWMFVQGLAYTPGKQILSCFSAIYTGAWNTAWKSRLLSPALFQATFRAFVFHSAAWHPYCDQAQLSLQHYL